MPVWLLLLILGANLASSICPNQCNGNGYCNPDSTCTCFPGWNGGAADCSYRNCPSGVAWTDKSYGVNLAHRPAECSNAGSCDRTTGTCTCFTGYTGITPPNFYRPNSNYIVNLLPQAILVNDRFVRTIVAIEEFV